ncbi:protein transport protein Sec39, putative [Talaromyces stipitatus ATCC 10500]|uniref:Protein transport protein Sec39, putative n=1 Tax=Talaromyces stipitatus (strain ATCC 10500 / CBS 375.48 / QM 6759 / NRRL 1006) TaxID=441959 RepID=B8M868_TALSN|nr:protein transport protein Sec39, putative [Talaromyces stipitatus ATCC 10500]EED20030.1 protein transport protein Sec39, putative [Talaromyces stipitatus ATCC 10500]
MANLDSLSDAQAILLACELCTAKSVSALPHLQQHFPTSLTTVRLFRILLSFLPESTPPQQYTTVLDEVDRGVALTPYSGDIDTTKVKNVEESVAWKRVRQLKLLPLKYPHADKTQATDSLTDFLIHRAHKIDVETGLQTYILELILPFYDRSELLRQWLVSKILPLLRSNYEYYPDKEDMISLAVLEAMDQTTGINVLLSMTGNNPSVTDLTRNLRGLVGPWMCGTVQSKRRRLSRDIDTNNVADSQKESGAAGWDDVNDWLLSQSLLEFDSVANTLDSWDGPEDVDLGGYMDIDYSTESGRLRRSYGQVGLAIVYATEPARGSFERLFQITMRVARLLQIDTAMDTLNEASLNALELDLTTISSASKASLLQNGLLRGDNALTIPSSQSISFLQAILLSTRILRDYGHITSCRSAASMCLHGNEETQSWEVTAVLDMIVKQPMPVQDWRKIREQILWLRDWKGSNAFGKIGECHGLFWKVSKTTLEIEILKAMVTTGEYRLVAEVYTEANSPLDLAQVETAVVDTIISFYDTASNGNRSRGKMKKAVEILNAFQPRFPKSNRFKELTALIAATHALSFYSLTLQHGVPFQPVSIRVHPDPLSLIEKVLDQNSKSYTKLEDLLSIGRNFVTAGLVSPDKLSQAQQVSLLAERRIISMAISSALAADDFGTAYSYILTRLTPSSLLPSTTSEISTTSPVEEDISWRAAYNAGRYRSPTLSSESDLTSQITNLSQRMELLSLSLILAPTADPLPEVLGAWRRCDEEMTILRNRESQEAEEWDRRGDQQSFVSTVPGSFAPTDRELDAYENAQRQKSRGFKTESGRRFDAEAPLGLFDVARGAARAFSKNLTPLQQHQQQTKEVKEEGEEMSKSTESLERERVRKRDVVSNMVTGGLASGIGWVLGAQPVNR